MGRSSALAQWQSRVDVNQNPPPPATLRHKKPQINEPKFDARTELYRIGAVDLT